MIEAEYLIFCKQVQLDTGGISLIGTSDVIPASGFPAAIADQITVVSKIRAKKELPGDAIPYRLEVEYDNAVVWGTTGNYPGRHVPKRGVMYFQVDMKGLKFEVPGWYYVNLYMAGKKLITRTLHADMPEKLKEVYGEQEVVQETN